MPHTQLTSNCARHANETSPTTISLEAHTHLCSRPQPQSHKALERLHITGAFGLGFLKCCLQKNTNQIWHDWLHSSHCHTMVHVNIQHTSTWCFAHTPCLSAGTILLHQDVYMVYCTYGCPAPKATPQLVQCHQYLRWKCTPLTTWDINSITFTYTSSNPFERCSHTCVI